MRVAVQTREALAHAREAGVVVVVAVTKCDKPGVDVARVKRQLLELEVELEEVGGTVPLVEVSGVTGLGMADLQHVLALQVPPSPPPPSLPPSLSLSLSLPPRCKVATWHPAGDRGRRPSR